MDLGMQLIDDAERLQETSGEGRIINNGMCDIIITNMYVNKSKDANNKGLAFNMEFKRAEDFNNDNASTQTIYQAVVYKKSDGTVNTYGQDLMSRIAKVTGKSQTEINKTVTKQIPMGKDKKMESVEAIPALCGAKLTGKFRQEFDSYNDKLIDKVRLLTVFRTKDKASASEIINHDKGKEVVLGKQYAMEAEKEITPKYLKDLTPEKVAELKKAGNSSSSSKASTDDGNFLDDVEESKDDIEL